MNYQTAGPQKLTLNGSLTAGNSTHTLIVTSYGTHYAKNATLTDDGARFATFTAVASPNVSVGNASLNPTAHGNHSQILRTFESNTTGVAIGDQVDTRTVQVLGSERNVSQFEGQVRLAENASESANVMIDVYVHVTRFEHRDDHIVVIAAYPQSSPGERETVRELLRALEHPPN